MMILRQHAKALLFVSLVVTVVFAALLVNYWQNKPGETPQPSAVPSGTSPSATQSPTSSVSPSPAPTLRPPPISPFFPTPTPVRLYPGEVREYQGQNLSSIADVYENAIAGLQYLNQANYSLTVNGLVNKTLRLTYDGVLAGHQLYQKIVTIYCVQGWNATILWEGILVKDLIQDAVPYTLANTVIFHASDGYTTSLPREYLESNNIILAYKMNGYVIPAEKGFPFQLVAESKYGYKWIKWITGIELSSDTGYLGYWESRGYSNNANVP